MKPDILCRTTRGNRQEWEKQRQRLFHGAYLGGSEAAAVLGLVPRRSPSQLMAEKLGRLESEDVSGITRVCSLVWNWKALWQARCPRRWVSKSDADMRSSNAQGIPS